MNNKLLLFVLGYCMPLVLISQEKPFFYSLNSSPLKTTKVDVRLEAKRENEKWGFFKNDELAIPYQYDSVTYFSEGLAGVKMNGKWGFINDDGEIEIQCQFDGIGSFNDNLVKVKVGEKWGIINREGKIISPYIFDYIDGFVDGISLVKQNNKYGFITKNGIPLTSCKYSEAYSFDKGIAWVRLDDRGKWGFINKDGVQTVPYLYDWPGYFEDDMALVSRDFKSGYINKNGETVIPFIFAELRHFSEGIAAAEFESSGKWCFINKKGERLFSNEYDDALSFHNGLCLIQNDNRWGVIDKAGNQIVPCIYDSMRTEFEYGMISVCQNGKWGYINNTNGAQIIPCAYDSLGYSFQDGLLRVSQNGLWGYANTDGVLVIPCRFQACDDFFSGEAIVTNGDSYYINKKGEYTRPTNSTQSSGNPDANFSYLYINPAGNVVLRSQPGIESYFFKDGMAPTSMNKKFGYMNKQGVVAIPCKYETLSDFYEGLAAVKLNDKWGYIFQDGTEAIPFQFEYAYNFNKGLAVVKMNGKWGYIRKTGQIAIPCQFSSAFTFKDGLAIVKAKGKYGFIDKQGNYVIPCKYEDIADDFYEDVTAVKLNGKWGYINKNNSWVIPCKYEEAASFNNGIAAVMLGGKFGLINKTDKIVVGFRFGQIKNYNDKFATVYFTPEHEEFGTLSKLNDPVSISENNKNYKYISTCSDSIIVMINSEGKYLATDFYTGNVIAEPGKFDAIADFFGGYAAVKKDGKSGFIDKNGSVVIPLKYHEVTFFKDGLAIVIE